MGLSVRLVLTNKEVVIVHTVVSNLLEELLAYIGGLRGFDSRLRWKRTARNTAAMMTATLKLLHNPKCSIKFKVQINLFARIKVKVD